MLLYDETGVLRRSAGAGALSPHADISISSPRGFRNSIACALVYYLETMMEAIHAIILLETSLCVIASHRCNQPRNLHPCSSLLHQPPTSPQFFLPSRRRRGTKIKTRSAHTLPTAFPTYSKHAHITFPNNLPSLHAYIHTYTLSCNTATPCRSIYAAYTRPPSHVLQYLYPTPRTINHTHLVKSKQCYHKLAQPQTNSSRSISLSLQIKRESIR
ncbi:unnamed protein product [Periconia digitata]|uniref:Uncharacterized protein n=1 Tax=Periconia digitata TaxID=1303443 RepID=A0A9W4U3R6_9PLEO|nr:unnamed protein product [Periconia digitata]